MLPPKINLLNWLTIPWSARGAKINRRNVATVWFIIPVESYDWEGETPSCAFIHFSETLHFSPEKNFNKFVSLFKNNFVLKCQIKASNVLFCFFSSFGHCVTDFCCSTFPFFYKPWINIDLFIVMTSTGYDYTSFLLLILSSSIKIWTPCKTK